MDIRYYENPQPTKQDKTSFKFFKKDLKEKKKPKTADCQLKAQSTSSLRRNSQWTRGNCCRGYCSGPGNTLATKVNATAVKLDRFDLAQIKCYSYNKIRNYTSKYPIEKPTKNYFRSWQTLFWWLGLI